MIPTKGTHRIHAVMIILMANACLTAFQNPWLDGALFKSAPKIAFNRIFPNKLIPANLID